MSHCSASAQCSVSEFIYFVKFLRNANKSVLEIQFNRSSYTFRNFKFFLNFPTVSSINIQKHRETPQNSSRHFFFHLLFVAINFRSSGCNPNDIIRHPIDDRKKYKLQP